MLSRFMQRCRSAATGFPRRLCRLQRPRRLTTLPEKVTSTAGDLVDITRRLEQGIMNSLHVNNRQKFWKVVATVFGTLGSLGVGCYIFSDEIKGFLSGRTAEVGSLALEDELVHQKAEAFFQALFAQVTSEEAVIDTASDFVSTVASTDRTKTTLVDLLVEGLKDPSWIAASKVFVTEVFSEVMADKKSLAVVQEFTREVLQSPAVCAATCELFAELTEDEDVRAGFTEMVVDILNRPEVKESLDKAGKDAASNLIDDRGLQQLASMFVQELLADENLQRQGGDALWQMVKYSIFPFGKKNGIASVVEVPLEEGGDSDAE